MSSSYCQCCWVDDHGRQCSIEDDLLEVVYGNAPGDSTIACKAHVDDMGCDLLLCHVFSHECEYCKPAIVQKKQSNYILIDCGDHFETRRKK
jgi:hypothetical protein